MKLYPPGKLHLLNTLILVTMMSAAVQVSGETYLFNRLDLATGKAPSSVATGDFRNIGKTDMVVANRDSNTISIILGRPDGHV